MLKSKKLIYFTMLALLLFNNVSAHGKKDVEDIDVENLNSWQEEFDLEHKKPGKYNIMVKARDLGGNVKVEGPYNLYLDPNSDLPVCGITNPYYDMRVVGNLNIVGTCIDDDAVSYVELVLDGNKDTPIRAEGKEFWSFYLDTLKMEEGPHTIQVTGYDINGLAGKPVSVRWQLDRNQPLTHVKDKEMGMLVSGTVKFDGEVSDGNQIKELEYSVDNGKYFIPIKIAKNKELCNFTISIDTKKFNDGPAVIWFKATDYAGSVGTYSFLYFIDNTKPDVKIVSPAENEVVNGKFTVAGYAKDTIGVEYLSWSFGNQNGVFDIIPGNPYWAVDIDTIGSKDKSQKFTIHAVDKVGNVVDVSRNIPINQEDDKPLVKTYEPAANQIFGGDEPLFVRGIVTDDDGVKAVKIQLDNNEPIIQETKGVYYYQVCEATELSAGKHKVTITGIDINDVEGNAYVTEIESKGIAPTFKNVQVLRGKDIIPVVNGLAVHPESNSTFEITANSQIGLKSVYTLVEWGREQSSENLVELKNVADYKFSWPVLPKDGQYGLVKFTVRATDSLDRESEYKTFIYVNNTTEIKAEDPLVVFEDSTVAEDGSIICNPYFPVSGYVIGENAVSAELVPKTDFAELRLINNQIELVSGYEVGTSAPITIKVVTDKNRTIYSKPLIFKNDTVLPLLTIEGYSDTNAINYYAEGVVNVKGNVSCDTGVGALSYRVLGSKIELKGGVISAFKPNPVPEEFIPIPYGPDGTFNLLVSEEEIAEDGMYVIEIVAESTAGNKFVRGVAVSRIPEIEEVNGKMPAAKPPVIAWLDGYDVYALAAYQGELDRDFAEYRRMEGREEGMQEGNNSIQMDVTMVETGKMVSAKYTAFKTPKMAVNIALVNGERYLNGMPVYMDYGTKEAGKISVYIDTSVTVSSVTYQFTGDEVAGGDVTQNGNAKLIKPTAENPGRWVAEIPVLNLPSRVNNFTVTVKAPGFEKVVKGAISILRNQEMYNIDDIEKIYTFNPTETVYDEIDENYILTAGSKFYYYANLTEPITATLMNANGLEIATEGKLITLTAKQDGNYKNVYVKVTDHFGDVYESEKFNFLADTGAPEVHLQTPEIFQWLGDVVEISGTAADAMGVRSVEYSLDNGINWTGFKLNAPKNSGNVGVTFSEKVDIASFEDGLIEINIRASDNAGHTAQILTAAYKDTTPPEVQVVQPLGEHVVNGETLVVFSAKDNGYFAKAEYVAPPVSGKPQTRVELPLNPLVYTIVGKEEYPIDDAMSFVFTDDAGNSSIVEAWDFSIDNQSDLPRSEIHLPEEMQVITRDFTISGVIYDDDGDTTIYYKLDDGEYIKYSEQGTSFSIDVALDQLTDNEHSVTVYAVDINGVKGEEVKRTFRVSLEEPKGSVELPTIDTSVREIVRISGVASDKNDISKIEISLDNGNSYNDAIGTTQWYYDVDSRAIPGGTQVVFLRITDGYGIRALYSSLINIDNDAPVLNLELPLDDSFTTGNLYFSGYTYDNVEVTDLYLTIRNLEKTGKSINKNIKIDRIIGESIDITDLDDGFYNVELSAKDKAGNVTNVSRNIHLDKARPPAVVDVLYPLNGEHKCGIFNIYGQAKAEGEIASLRLYIDDAQIMETELTDCGFFNFAMGPEYITDGVHRYRVDTVLQNGKQIASKEQTISYTSVGPWVTIDNFNYGDFAINRPYLRGQAGYSISEDELLFSKTKEATPEQKAITAAKKVDKIELSFDNGKTFTLLSKNEKWIYRIENEDIAEGTHFMILRATMKNGETAITRTVVQIDNTQPTITLIAPIQGGKYNQKLAVSGLSNDDVRLEDVTVTLRKGDKSSYELPSFIQGLYLDFHFMGATLFDIGAGLTFFNDVVKIQAQWGQYTQAQRDAVSGVFKRSNTNMRYGGNSVFGVKILANITSIPFSYFLGHDWEWLYASISLGAQFTRFNQTNSGKAQILSAVLGQFEFPRVKLQNVKAFSSFAFYTEASLWFIPTDVSSTTNAIKNLIPQVSVGIRTNIF